MPGEWGCGILPCPVVGFTHPYRFVARLRTTGLASDDGKALGGKQVWVIHSASLSATFS